MSLPYAYYASTLCKKLEQSYEPILISKMYARTHGRTNERTEVNLKVPTASSGGPISFHNSIVLRGLLGIMSGLRFFPEITHMKKIIYNKMQLLAKFQQNPMKRLEIIGKKHNFLALISYNPGIKIFFQKNKNVTFFTLQISIFV